LFSGVTEQPGQVRVHATQLQSSITGGIMKSTGRERWKFPATLAFASFAVFLFFSLLTGSMFSDRQRAIAGPAADTFGSWILSPQGPVLTPSPVPGGRVTVIPSPGITLTFVVPTPWDTAYVRVGSVIRDNQSGVYRMYYESARVFTVTDGTFVRSKSAIGVALSDDGITWQKAVTTGPIFGPSQPDPADLVGTNTVSSCPGAPVSTWDQDFVGAPRVIYDGTRYRMFYVGGNGSRSWNENVGSSIGLAESFDGINFCRVSADPVLRPTGVPGQFDSRWVYPNSVRIEGSGGSLRLYYTGGSEDPANYQSGIARTPAGFAANPGLTLARQSGNPIRVNGSSSRIRQTYVLDVSGVQVMWYVSGESGTDLIYQAYGANDFNFTRDPSGNIIALNTQGSPNDLVGQVDIGGVFDQGFVGLDPARDAFLYFTGRNATQLQFNIFRAVSPNPAIVPVIPTPPPGQVTPPIIPTPGGTLPTPTPQIPGNPPPPPNGGPGSFLTPTPGDGNYPAFFNLWRRTDEPVRAGLVNRSWLFGPQPYGFRFLREPYEEGTRLVMYHDKARMESTPNGGVTNGLLVRELVSGEMQVGDNKFEPRTQGNETVAGDPIELNTVAPAYYSLRPVASINNDKRQGNKTGQPVFETLNRAGFVGQDFSKTGFNIRYVYYDNTLGHNIADVFWNYMQQGGLVLSGNNFANERIFDWLPVMGLPISEAYWTRAVVGGREIDVLVQAFERRVLTFTPSNPAGFQVEMGNVGRHYFRWRYGLTN
jgi:hypothetical protein